MKTNSVIVFIVSVFHVCAQQFGHFASAVYMQTCTSEKFYNVFVERAAPDCINPQCDTVFGGKDFGMFYQNSNDLILRGGEIKSFRGSNSNVCGGKLYYTIYQEGNRPAEPTFLELNMPHVANCNLGTFTFQDNYGHCIDRDQKWGSQAYQVNLTTLPPGSYALEVYFELFGDHTSTNNCDDTVIVNNSAQNFIAYFQLTDAFITAQGLTTFCEGGTVVLTSSSSNGNVWTTGETTQSITVSSSGSYGLFLPSLNACETTDQTSIDVTVLPIPTVNAGTDLTICQGQSVTLNATGATNYSWNQAVSNGVSFVPNQTETYIVTGSTANCSDQDTVIVEVLEQATSQFTAIPLLVETGQPVMLQNQSTGQTFFWDFGNGNTIVTSSSDPQIQAYTAEGQYTIMLISSNGNCADTSFIAIDVVDSPDIEVLTPNVFTPNGDDDNDLFEIPIQNGLLISATVFNRWGAVMKELTSENPYWDGKVNGKMASDGTYFYTYRVKDMLGNEIVGQNFVTLLNK